MTFLDNAAPEQSIEEQISHLQVWISSVGDWLIGFLPKLLGALIIMAIGLVISKYITKLILKTMKKGKVDPTVKSFVNSIIRVSLQILVILCALSTVGVDITSIIAVLGTAAVAVGLALKDSMSNIASGLIIIINKSFKVGDYLEVEGFNGTVTKIEMMYTTLLSADGKEIILPNSRVTSNNIINYNVQNHRRLELHFSISYDDDIAAAKKVIYDLIESDSRIDDIPEAPLVGVDNHGSSGINLIVKVWCLPENYWTLRYDIPERVKYAFDENNITIPYNRLDVELISKVEDKVISIKEDKPNDTRD